MNYSKMPTSELVYRVVTDRRVDGSYDEWKGCAEELDRRFPVQPAPVSGWQPISTAPDEGCILVYDPGIGEYIAWRTFRGGWMSHHPDTRRNPTHWMPLPEVPR